MPRMVETEKFVKITEVNKEWRRKWKEGWVKVSFEDAMVGRTLEDYLKHKKIRNLMRKEIKLNSPLHGDLDGKEAKEALEIFSVILRLTRNELISAEELKKGMEKIFHKVMKNLSLKNELFLQIINQLFFSSSQPFPPSPILNAVDNTYSLLALALSSFKPSPCLFVPLLNFLLNVIHSSSSSTFSHAFHPQVTLSTPNHVFLCKQNLLQNIFVSLGSFSPSSSSIHERTDPPCLLECLSSQMPSSMALPCSFYNEVKEEMVLISSWITGEQFASNFLVNFFNLPPEETKGWSVLIKKFYGSFECQGHECLLDLISQLEILPDSQTQISTNIQFQKTKNLSTSDAQSIIEQCFGSALADNTNKNNNTDNKKKNNKTKNNKNKDNKKKVSNDENDKEIARVVSRIKGEDDLMNQNLFSTPFVAPDPFFLSNNFVMQNQQRQMIVQMQNKQLQNYDLQMKLQSKTIENKILETQLQSESLKHQLSQIQNNFQSHRYHDNEIRNFEKINNFNKEKNLVKDAGLELEEDKTSKSYINFRYKEKTNIIERNISNENSPISKNNKSKTSNFIDKQASQFSKPLEKSLPHPFSRPLSPSSFSSSIVSPYALPKIPGKISKIVWPPLKKEPEKPKILPKKLWISENQKKEDKVQGVSTTSPLNQSTSSSPPPPPPPPPLSTTFSTSFSQPTNELKSTELNSQKNKPSQPEGHKKLTLSMKNKLEGILSKSLSSLFPSSSTFTPTVSLPSISNIVTKNSNELLTSKLEESIPSFKTIDSRQIKEISYSQNPHNLHNQLDISSKTPSPIVIKKFVSSLKPPKSSVIYSLVPPLYPTLTYLKPSWSLKLRKEFFYPKERMPSDKRILKMISNQIINDYIDKNRIRLTESCLQKVTLILDSIKLENLSSSSSITNLSSLVSFISSAPPSSHLKLVKSVLNLPLYFSKIFTVKCLEDNKSFSLICLAFHSFSLSHFHHGKMDLVYTFLYNDLEKMKVEGNEILIMEVKNGKKFHLYTPNVFMIEYLISEYKKADSQPSTISRVISLTKKVEEEKVILRLHIGKSFQIIPIKPSMSVKNVLEMACQNLGIFSLLNQSEFIISFEQKPIWTFNMDERNAQEHLNLTDSNPIKEGYLKRGLNFISLDHSLISEAFLDLLYSQYVNDYLVGYYTPLPLDSSFIPDIVLATALQFSVDFPSSVIVSTSLEKYLPRSLWSLWEGDQLRENVEPLLVKYSTKSEKDKKVLVLDLLTRCQMFGSNFFNISDVNSNDYQATHSVLAINSKGIFLIDILSKQPKLKLNHNEIQEIREIAKATDKVRIIAGKDKISFYCREYLSLLALFGQMNSNETR